MRHCWTCNTEHDLDERCGQFPTQRAPEGPGNELFDTTEDVSELGPAFTAGFDSDDSCCGEGIYSGERIRADGHGGWVHDTPECLE